MSRTPRNELAAAELGKRLTELRDQHPDKPKPKVIERWLLTVHGLEVSDEAVRQAHVGHTDPTACQVDLLVGLAAFYEVPVSALGRFAGERVARVLAMAGSSNPNGPRTPSDQADDRLS